jgi:hypothetical protein
MDGKDLLIKISSPKPVQGATQHDDVDENEKTKTAFSLEMFYDLNRHVHVEIYYSAVHSIL